MLARIARRPCRRKSARSKPLSARPARACSGARSGSRAGPEAARAPRRRTARAAPRAAAPGTSRGRSRRGSRPGRRGRRRRASASTRRRVKPAARRRRSVSSGVAKVQSVAQPAKCSANARPAAASKPACLTSATLPWPPHCATSRPPGLSAACRFANSRSWSPIQWNVAVESTASTGSSSASSGRSAWRTSTPAGSSARACSTIDGAASTAITRPCGSRSCSTRVTLPVPQPASSTVSSPRSTSRSSTSAPIAVSGAGEALVGGGVPVARRHPSTTAARPRRARAHELAHLVGALAPLAEHVRGDDLGVGRVGPADADPDALEVRAAELALERLQPVVARQPAAEPHADVAERQVDLVVDHEHAVELSLKAPRAGPTERPASFM